jgi:hypothetical protein
VLEITHPEIFNSVVEEAKRRAGGDARWCAAIDRAEREIRDNPMMHWQGASMLIQSPKSAEVYEANGDCQCRAYDFHRACWHRAAARVWRLYLDAVAEREWKAARASRAATETKADASALLVTADRRTEKIGAFQI